MQIDKPRHGVVVVAGAVAVVFGVRLGELAEGLGELAGAACGCDCDGELGEHALAATQTSVAKTTFPSAPATLIILPTDARATGIRRPRAHSVG